MLCWLSLITSLCCMCFKIASMIFPDTEVRLIALWFPRSSFPLLFKNRTDVSVTPVNMVFVWLPWFSNMLENGMATSSHQVHRLVAIQFHEVVANLLFCYSGSTLKWPSPSASHVLFFLYFSYLIHFPFITTLWSPKWCAGLLGKVVGGGREEELLVW